MSDPELKPTPRVLLRQMFDAAIASAQPALCVPPHLPAAAARQAHRRRSGQGVRGHGAGGGGELVRAAVGAGGDALRLRRAVRAHRHRRSGASGAGCGGHACGAAHARAGRRACSEDDLVLCLFSGGGSALLPLPAPGLDLDLKQIVSRALLACGATISEMNCVRRHLSAIKGGRLAAACHPARVLTLLISDVPGDRPIDIASGPTVADPTTCADALAIVRRYGIELPRPVRECAGKRPRRIREARRPAAGAVHGAHDRHSADGARGRRRRGARGGRRTAHSRRRDRRRGARRGQGVCRAWHSRSPSAISPSPRPACCCPAARPR